MTNHTDIIVSFEGPETVEPQFPSHDRRAADSEARGRIQLPGFVV